MNANVKHATRMDVHLPSGLTPANTNAELIAAGYRRTSNKYGLISRIESTGLDRRDHREHASGCEVDPEIPCVRSVAGSLSPLL